MEAHTCFPGTWETKARGFSIKVGLDLKLKEEEKTQERKRRGQVPCSLFPRNSALTARPPQLGRHTHTPILLPVRVRAHTGYTHARTCTQTHSLIHPSLTPTVSSQMLHLIKTYGRFPWFMVGEGGVYFTGKDIVLSLRGLPTLVGWAVWFWGIVVCRQVR